MNVLIEKQIMVWSSRFLAQLSRCVQWWGHFGYASTKRCIMLNFVAKWSLLRFKHKFGSSGYHVVP